MRLPLKNLGGISGRVGSCELLAELLIVYIWMADGGDEVGG